MPQKMAGVLSSRAASLCSLAQVLLSDMELHTISSPDSATLKKDSEKVQGVATRPLLGSRPPC